MRLNSQERVNLEQLSKAYRTLAARYTDDDTCPLHVPHAVLAFAHTFFHDVFEGAVFSHAQAAMAQGADLDDDDEIVVGGVDMEPLLRKCFEMVLLTGIEYGREYKHTAQCRCAESFGDVVEEALRGGECGHQ